MAVVIVVYISDVILFFVADICTKYGTRYAKYSKIIFNEVHIIKFMIKIINHHDERKHGVTQSMSFLY